MIIFLEIVKKIRKYKDSRERGYTLIELLVVMSIIVVLTAITTVSLREGNSNLALRRSTQNVIQTLELAKSYSLGGKLHEGTISPGGYGVHFSRIGSQAKRIVIFADCDNDGEYDVGGGSATSCDTATPAIPYSEHVTDIVLEQSISVWRINRGSPCFTSGPWPQDLDVTFQPPDPQTEFYSNIAIPPSCIEPFIRIRSSVTQENVAIFINKLGVARVEGGASPPGPPPPPTNTAPTINLATDTPDPIEEGNTITFTVDWTDPEGDSAAVILCKTNAVSAGAIPGCSVATWTGPVTSPSPTILSYNTQAADVGTRNYYAFACDSSGLCSLGFSGSFEVTSVPIPASGALEFSGIDRVNLGSPASLDNINPISICAWVSSSSFGNDGRIYVKDTGGSSGKVLDVREENNYLEYRSRFSDGMAFWRTPYNSMLEDSSWQHVCVSHDNSNATNLPAMYIDGSPQTVTVVTARTGTPNSDASYDAVIGNRPDGLRPFTGLIDEVSIYNKIITSTEVSDQFNLGSGTYGCSESGLVSGYHFDEGANLTANDYAGSNNGVLVGAPSWVGGKVVEDICVPPPVSGGSGTILREYWSNIGSGISVSDLTGNMNYPDNPTGSNEPTLFEAPTNWGSNYGTRMRGYVHARATGSYTFWVASDDMGELWLSTDESPSNASLVAWVPSWTTSRQWGKYAQQQSSSVTLTAGQKYYIEALQKEGGGGDNLAVAWQGPGIAQTVIDGGDLSPWVVLPSSDLNLALVVGNSGGLSLNSDIPIRDRLSVTLGHTVTIFDDNNTGWSPTSYDAVVISESVGSSATSWLKSRAVPLLTLEGANWDEFDLGTSGNTAGGGSTTVTITDNTHYITQLFSLGTLTVSTSSSDSGQMGGWSNGVQSLANYTATPTDSKLLYVNNGDTLADGTTSAERRVFLGANAFGNLNANGLTMFDRALRWLTATSLSIRVSQGSDDAEEDEDGVAVSTSSSDLELVFDGGTSSGNQTVGIRFQNVNIPQGSTITNAYIEFEADETATGATSLVFKGEASGNAGVFQAANGNISSRTTTTASVNWGTVPSWNTVNQKHRTPDLSSIVQEIVGLPGWASASPIVIIITGTGQRTAESYNGESGAAALLHIEYLQ